MALAKTREVARLLQDRALPLTPLAGHPLSVLEFEEWTPTWAEDTQEVISEVQRLAVEASGSTKELLAAFKVGPAPRVASRTHSSRRARREFAGTRISRPNFYHNTLEAARCGHGALGETLSRENAAADGMRSGSFNKGRRLSDTRL